MGPASILDRTVNSYRFCAIDLTDLASEARFFDQSREAQLAERRHAGRRTSAYASLGPIPTVCPACGRVDAPGQSARIAPALVNEIPS